MKWYADSSLSWVAFFVLCLVCTAGHEVFAGSSVLIDVHPDQSASADTVIQSLTNNSGGSELQQSFQALAIRKNEALPRIKKMLKIGDVWEKQSLIKFIQYSSWPEVSTELIEIVTNPNEHWLSRQGALYALGEIGDINVGAEILSVLDEPNCPQCIQLIAISTLARIGYKESAPVIRKFTEHEDIHIRLFACRALAEFGEPVDIQFLLSSLNDQDYVVRQDACGALAAVEGEDITQRLSTVAKHDMNESVRSVAQVGLLERQIRCKAPLEKLDILKNAIEQAERRTIPWIIKTTLKECGQAGEDNIRQLGARDDKTGERARAFLIAQNLSSANPFSGDTAQTKEIEIGLMHTSTPTHQTLMEYAISQSGSLPTPLNFTSVQETRMNEGSIDEDNDYRPLDHAYNPLTGASWNIGGRTPTYNEALTRWDSMAAAFYSASFDGGDNVGAWHYLGRVSHLLQDMSSPSHIFAMEHAIVKSCKFEAFWQGADSTLRYYLYNIGGPLNSSDPLPFEAVEKLDAFTKQRLQFCYANSCPDKYNDDVRGWIDVLAWTTYFRTTFWGEVKFGTYGGNGNATSPQTTGTTFSDGYVGAQTNTLHTMFNGNIKYIDGWLDNYYEIIDCKGFAFRWMSWSDIDDWSSCGRNWANGRQDSSIGIGGSDDDAPGVRITGRFWFDTPELGGSASCYPYKYPNGDVMTDNLLFYFGKYGYPLTVRYNAGLLGLANRRITVETTSGYVGFSLGRRDNFGNGQYFTSGTSGSHYYFVAKSSVTLEAAYTNSDGWIFSRWLRNGFSHSTSRSITINTQYDWIPEGGDVYTAEYVDTNLSYIKIEGPINIYENSSVQYTCTAYYKDGSSSNITNNAMWSENSSCASISSNGYLTTFPVFSDLPCTIAASYGGKSDKYDMTICDMPVVTIDVTDTQTTENLSDSSVDYATFRVTRTGSTSSQLLVYFSKSGTANWTIDYVCDGGAGDIVIIEIGASYADVVVRAVADFFHEGNETVTWTLQSNSAYTIGNSGSATLTVVDNADISANMQGIGSHDDPYQISTIHHLEAINDNLSAHYILAGDIDLAGKTYAMAVIAPDTSTVSGFQGTKFTGSLSGNGFSIENLLIEGGPSSRYLGLFGYIEGGAVINDIRLYNCRVSGSLYAGGLTGCNSNCSIINCYVAGEVNGSNGYVGGLVGYTVYGAITNCAAIADVTGLNYVGGLTGYNFSSTITGCCVVGSVVGSSIVGGLTGNNDYQSIITNCYAAGNVSGSTSVGGLAGRSTGSNIVHCYSAGAISGMTDAGGLVGNFSACIVGTQTIGAITNCFWDINTLGGYTGYNLGGDYPVAIINVMGKTTPEMQARSTFTAAGWNFDTIWKICEGTDYPKLLFEANIPGDILCPEGVGLEDFCKLASQWQLFEPEGDINASGKVDMGDFTMISSAWGTSTGERNYDLRCDISSVGTDGVINVDDIMVFVNEWLFGWQYSSDIDSNGVVNIDDAKVIIDNWLEGR